LLDEGKADQLMNLSPYQGLLARPSTEAIACMG